MKEEGVRLDYETRDDDGNVVRKATVYCSPPKNFLTAILALMLETDGDPATIQFTLHRPAEMPEEGSISGATEVKIG